MTCEEIAPSKTCSIPGSATIKPFLQFILTHTKHAVPIFSVPARGNCIKETFPKPFDAVEPAWNQDHPAGLITSALMLESGLLPSCWSQVPGSS